MSGQNEPTVGDRVLVPWGLDEVEGEVVEVYSTGLGPRATVRLVGESEGPTVVLPLDSLVPTAASRDVSSNIASGGWMDYERLVASALRRAATELNLAGPVVGTPDTGVDFELRLGKRHLLIDVKHYGGRGYVSTDTILTVTGLARNDAAVLLVADVPMAATAKQRLQQLSLRSRVSFVQWRGSEDDRELRAAFNRLLLRWK